MTKINWLHLTDFHCGLSLQDRLWPNIETAFLEDLKRLHDKCGPWDLVFFTGDLVQCGSVDEFNKLDEVLVKLWEHLGRLGSVPTLFAVPGNHDLVRPTMTPAVRLLAKWNENPEVHEEFWGDASSDYRKVVNSAFANYMNWTKRQQLGPKSQHQTEGMIPGDFSATVEKQGIKFGILGLNTAFLQLTKGDYRKKLALDLKQFNAACGGDSAAWVNQHHVRIIMTHHPLEWLNSDSSKHQSEIVPAGRFAIHLFGHMHEGETRSVSVDGGAVQRSWQGRALFGLEKYYVDATNKKEERRHGYSIGQLSVGGIKENRNAQLRHWPRKAQFHAQNGWSISADQDKALLDDGGMKCEELETLPAHVLSAVQSSQVQSKLGVLAKDYATRDDKPRFGNQGPASHEYLEAVRECHGHIRFVEIPFLKETPDAAIDNLYVSPKFSIQEIHADTLPGGWPKCVDAIDGLRDHQRLILLGDPGSGKSTLVSYLAWHLSEPSDSTQKESWVKDLGSPVALPIVLRELKLKADLTWESLLDAFLSHRIGRLLKSRSHIEELLQSGRAFVMLDGLDEIGNLTVLRKLRDAVHVGMSTYQQARWLLTSRVVGYEHVPFHISVPDNATLIDIRQQRKLLRSTYSNVADLLYLAPFSDKQIGEFSLKWYKRNETNAAIVAEQAENLVSGIHDNDGTQRLARIPYLLTLMALIHRKNARLPHGRTELYDRIAAAYLESIDVRRELDQLPYSLAQKKRWLAEIGYRMQLHRAASSKDNQSRYQAILVGKDDIHKWLVRSMIESSEDAQQEASTLLDYFARRSGLLLPRGEGQFAFMHLSLQEYFAACFLEQRLTASRFSAERKTEPEDGELRQWANKMVWRETFVLLFELLASKPQDESEGLLRHLFEKRLDTDAPRRQRTAARLLAELITDPYVAFSAETRKRMRLACWRWEFAPVPPNEAFEGIQYSSGIGGITQALLAEQGGSLSKAWGAAGISDEELENTVTRLSLSGCSGLSDLSALANLKRLETLDLSGCKGVKELGPLSRLKNLRELSLNGCGSVVDLSPLLLSKNLRQLDLSRCGGVNLRPLVQMCGLVELTMSYEGQKEHIRALAGLVQLENLLIEFNEGAGAVDLKPLRNLQGLRQLHLHGLTSADLTPLVDLPKHIMICTAGSSKLNVPPELRRRVSGTGRAIRKVPEVLTEAPRGNKKKARGTPTSDK